MERVLVRDLPNFIGQEIIFKGWVAQIRKLGGITFMRLRDRSGEIQGIINSKEIKDLPTKESCVTIKGLVKREEQAEKGLEILIKEIIVIERSKELPFEVGRRRELLKLKIDTILDYRPLALRNPVIGGVFRIAALITKGFREFLEKEDFLEVHTSKIISQATEGGSSLFSVQYFDKKAFLTQSPQFYKQMLVGAGYERVYEIGFVYRAEDHDTSRHLNEYVSLDLEMGFIQDEHDIIDLEVSLLKHIWSRLTERQDLLSLFGVKEISFPKEIPRIEYEQALVLLGRKEKDTDFTPEEEKRLSAYGKEKFDSDFLFVTKFPAGIRPFYTMPDKKLGFSRSFDLLYKGIEVTTGSQRIHNPKMLKENMIKFGLNPEEFKFYLEIFNYGMPPHGGLAIGLERLTSALLGLTNIRSASLFPRDRKRLTP